MQNYKTKSAKNHRYDHHIHTFLTLSKKTLMKRLVTENAYVTRSSFWMGNIETSVYSDKEIEISHQNIDVFI